MKGKAAIRLRGLRPSLVETQARKVTSQFNQMGTRGDPGGERGTGMDRGLKKGESRPKGQLPVIESLQASVASSVKWD